MHPVAKYMGAHNMGDIVDKIIVILTNFVVYLTFHPQFQTNVWNAGTAIFSGLQ